MSNNKLFSLPLFFLFLSLLSCTAQPGPDKTIAGAALGAGWGAGAGMIVANQVGATGGEGAWVGGGLGMISGAASGYAYDQDEDALMEQEHQLASLKIQNLTNTRQLSQIQAKLDRTNNASVGGVYQVYFDVNQTNLRAGAIANLEVIANAIKSNPQARKIHVVGHADDAGTPGYNERLAEARARAVSSYLAGSGISMDQIEVESQGSKRPVASNGSDVGRQMNRRVDVYVSGG